MSKEIEQHVLQQYQTITFLGSGAYGHVWKAKNRLTDKIYALKKIFDAFQNDVDAQRTYRQVTILPQLNHESIIKLHEVIKSQNNRDLYLVFELMETDLHSVLGENILQETHIRFIAYQMCKALKYIHSAQLIHRDLKSSNILINSACQIKICDFGLVRSLLHEQNTQLILSQDVATRWYRSPQILFGATLYGKPTDIWSVGCIIAELVRGEPIFPGNSNLEQLEKILQFTGKPTLNCLKSLNSEAADIVLNQLKIKKRNFKSYFKDINEDIKDMILKMLQFDPAKRITAEQALQLPCLQEFRGKTRQDVCKKFILTQIDDNSRLTLEDYRRKIYCDIQRRYPTSNGLPIIPRLNPNRSFHSLNSHSLHQTRKTASNSLVKLQKHPQLYKVDAQQQKITKYTNFKSVKPAKEQHILTKISHYGKQNHEASCSYLANNSTSEFQSKQQSKVFKRRAKKDIWAKYRK